MPKNFGPLALTNGLLVLLLLLASSCSKTDEDSTAQSNEMVAPPAATDLASPQGHPLDASAPPLITQVQAAKAAADLPIDHLPFAKVNPSYKYENQLVLARDSFVIDERNPALSGREYFLQFYLLNETDLSYYTAFRGMVVKFAYHEKPNGEGEVKIITYDDLDPSLVGMHLGITPLKPVAHWQTIPHPKSRKQVVGTCFGGSDNLYNRLLRSSFIPGKVDRIRDLYTCSPDFTAQTNLTTQEILIEGTMQINHGPVAENKLALRSLDVMRYVIVLTPYQRENALIPHNFSKKEDPYYLCGDTVYSNANGGYVNYTLKRNLARAPFYYYFA
ncbi:MAG: hypothetical protein J6Y94_03915, partial [Bacteriovoracaceae bacterium]|nr:hypothetical protein [Bacteriovoracaceae bacterium]